MKTIFLSLLTLLLFAHLSSPAEAMWNGEQEELTMATFAPKVRTLFPDVAEEFADNEALAGALSSGGLSSTLQSHMEGYRSADGMEESTLLEMQAALKMLQELLAAQTAATLADLALRDEAAAAEAPFTPTEGRPSSAAHDGRPVSLATMEEEGSVEEGASEVEEGSDYEEAGELGLARMNSQMPTVGESGDEGEEEKGEETEVVAAAGGMPPLMRTLSQMPDRDSSGDEAEHGSSPLSPSKNSNVFGPLRAPTEGDGADGGEEGTE